MSWADLNPLKRAKKHEASKVYVGVNPEHPSVGLSVILDVKPMGASICVEGIPLRQAQLDLCGKVLDWDKMPAKLAASLRAGGSLTLPIDRLKSLFR